MVEMIKPQPGKQTMFHKANTYLALYGGAKGGGKSFSLVLEGARQIANPNYRGAIFRRTFPQLKQILDVMRKIYPLLGGVYKETKKLWIFPSGAILYLGYLQYEKDIEDWRGIEINYLAFDEITHFTEYMFDEMCSCVRTSSPDVKCYVRCSCNPGGVGVAWVKRRFIDITTPMEVAFLKRNIDTDKWEKTDSSDPEAIDQVFIPASVYDNKILLKNNPKYLTRLKNLPKKQREAYLDGNWDVLEGQFFEEYDREVVEIKGWYEPDLDNKIMITMDYGHGKGATAIEFAEILPDGRIRLYKELTLMKHTYSDVAKKLYNFTQPEERGIINVMIVDPALFKDTQHHGGSNMGESGGEILQNVLMELGWSIAVIPADNRRVTGWGIFREYIKVREDRNGVKFSNLEICNKRCPQICYTIPTLVHDNHNPDDIDTDGEDHWADAVRYLLMSRVFGLKKKKDEYEPADIIEKMVIERNKILQSPETYRRKMQQGIRPGMNAGRRVGYYL